MKKLAYPQGFDGASFAIVAGYGPESAEDGYITNCPDSMTQADIDGMVIDTKPIKEAALWTAATNYEQSFVANAAYSGLLEAKLAGSPKAIAFGNWITALWAEYYSRKDALLAATTQAEIDAISEDFSSVGEPPYTIRDVLFGV